MLLATCYLALGAFIAAVEAQRMKARQPFNALSFFNGAYFIFFVFAPLNVIVFGEEAVRQKYAFQAWSHGDIWTALSLFLTYAAFILGYSRKREIGGASGGLSVGQRELRIATSMAVVFFFVGALALAYHATLVGGPLATLYFAPQVRTGEFELDGGLLFVRQFSAFLATAFMLYWVVGLDDDSFGRNERVAPPYRYLFSALLGIAFVYYALSTYGRREFFYPMLACLIVWKLSGRRRSWNALIELLALSALWFWLYSFVISASDYPLQIQSTPAQSVSAGDFLFTAYFRTVQGLADSFMHFVAAGQARLWQFGFLADIWEMPGQLVPSQVLGFDRSRGMYGETSEFILGRPLEPGLSGEEPLGLHGYLLVNFAYPGMFLLFYFAGIGYRRLDAAMRPQPGGSALSWLVFLWAIIGALELLRDGVLVLVLKPHISWWVALTILIVVGRHHRARREATLYQQSQNG